MNRNMWILAALLATLSIAIIWRSESGQPDPKWTLCKESLITQVFTGKCTLKFDGKQTAS
ncbi:hypothetical protein N9X12_03390 [Alphaproteobacteria bacterium]|nr:hypothetical protein [Alphaproteobacteria bacterium]